MKCKLAKLRKAAIQASLKLVVIPRQASSIDDNPIHSNVVRISYYILAPLPSRSVNLRLSPPLPVVADKQKRLVKEMRKPNLALDRIFVNKSSETSGHDRTSSL